MKSTICTMLLKQAARDMKPKLDEEAAEWSYANAKDYAQDYDHEAFRHAYNKYNDRNRNIVEDTADTVGKLVSTGGALSTVFGFPVMLGAPLTGMAMVGGGIGAWALGNAMSSAAEPTKYKALYDDEFNHWYNKRTKARTDILKNPKFINDVNAQYQAAKSRWHMDNPGKTPTEDDLNDFYYSIDYPALFAKYKYPKNIPLKNTVPADLQNDYNAYLSKHKHL